MLVALAMLAARSLAAQAPQERDGFWWAFGAGYGSYHHNCERCERPTGTTGTTSGYVALGIAASRRVSLGLEFASGWLAGETHTTSTSFVAGCYPLPRRGLFVRGGVGTSSYRQRSYAESPPFRGSGSGWLASLGWDLRVDRRLSFTPMLTYRAGAPGTVTVLVDTAAVNLRQRSVTFTVGLTFH